MPVNKWIVFLKKNKGQGMTMSELGRLYKGKSKSPKSKSPKSKSPKSTKKICRSRLKKKISINIKEGKWKSPKQAVAVSYSQIRKKFPKCIGKL